MRFLAALFTLALLAAAPALPFHSFTSLDHRHIAYTVQGDGSPMVVIPGGPGLDGAYMREAVRGLHARAYVIDPRGTGRSPVPEQTGTISLRALVSDLEQLRISQHINRWIVMGHSFGGFVAQTYAANYPQHVTALILVSSSAPDLALEGQVQQQINERLSASDKAALQHAKELSTSDPDAASRLQMDTLMPHFFADRSKWPKFAPYMHPPHNSYAMARALYPDLTQNHYAGSLENLHRPVLIMYGQQDGGVDTFVRAIRQTTNGRVAIVKNAGHFMWLEQPKVFNDTINTFLNNLS